MYFISWKSAHNNWDMKKAVYRWHFWMLLDDNLVFKRYDSATSQWYSSSSNERSGRKYEDWVNSQSEELYLCLTNGLIYRYEWTYSFFCMKWLLKADTNGRIFLCECLTINTDAEIVDMSNYFLESHGLSLE